MYRILLVVTIVTARTVKLLNLPPENLSGIKSYDIEVPGRDPIRIYEADPLWDNNRQPQKLDFRRFPTETPSTSLNEHNLVENSTKLYSPEALNSFLKSYAEKIREKRPQDVDRSDTAIEESDDDYDKSKRWGLGNKKNNHEEKDGWVQMEAIPWSSSQISKWTAANKPKPTPYYRPETNYHKPSYERPHQKPKPIYEYNSNPFVIKPNEPYIHVSNRPSWNEDKKPYITVAYDNYSMDDERDIITDGRPSDFPSRYVPRRPYEPLQERPSTSINHPNSGNGEWVLLSTTKGYQYPRQKSQRSIPITPNAIGVKRSVRLTVLPPEPNSKVNMTTSHGGLLEVESTFETVEESQKIMSERLQMNKTKNKPPRTVQKLRKRKPQPKIDEMNLPVVQNSRKNHQHETSAVLAAIGAGMVPATMAMLMPLVNGRRKRSVLNVTNVPFTELELTLQKSY